VTWKLPAWVATKVAVAELVNTGDVSTDSTAALLVADPAVLVNTARYWFPLSPDAAVKLKVVFVAPEISFQLVPPLVLTCHWTVGVGLPVAAAVKLAV
jgi:hypothetical protein